MSPNYNADKLNTYLVNFDSVTIEKVKFNYFW